MSHVHPLLGPPAGDVAAYLAAKEREGPCERYSRPPSAKRGCVLILSAGNVDLLVAQLQTRIEEYGREGEIAHREHAERLTKLVGPIASALARAGHPETEIALFIGAGDYTLLLGAIRDALPTIAEQLQRAQEAAERVDMR